ncbi:MAG: hypothetical protein GMKNLPBB_01472 [Myxococcota bacterium]|nr:hypothetical protein [Myxococcota bacterium]
MSFDKPAPETGVYVNRHLKMSVIHAVGFDMDYTLAIYRIEEMERTAFELAREILVRDFGYPRETLQARFDPGFVIRGLALDGQEGNVIKLDRFRHVRTAYHGRRKLTEEEIAAIYRKQRISFSSERFEWIDTLFSMPETCLFAEIVEMMEQGRYPVVDTAKLCRDIRVSVDTCHRDGSLKGQVRRHMDNYIERDELLAPTLHLLRSSGKKLFLLTNSELEHSDAVMGWLLNGQLNEYPHWTTYFDAIIVTARKPGFFTGHEPFLPARPDDPAQTVRTLERGRIVMGGNLRDFEQMFGVHGEHILYVGDHIYGDILRSKKHTLWRTCMIIPELQREISLTRRLTPEHYRHVRLERERENIEREILALRLELRNAEHEPKEDRLRLDQLKRRLRQLSGEADQLLARMESQFNPWWGPLLKEGADTSFFGDQVEDYACIYTSKASNFLRYSPVHFFRSPRDYMPHELELWGGAEPPQAQEGDGG